MLQSLQAFMDVLGWVRWIWAAGVHSVLSLISCGFEPKLSPHCVPCIGDLSWRNSDGTRFQPPGEQTWTVIASCCIPSGTGCCCSPLHAVCCKSISILAGMLKHNHPLCSLGLQQPDQGSCLGDSVGSLLAWDLLCFPRCRGCSLHLLGNRIICFPKWGK